MRPSPHHSSDRPATNLRLATALRLWVSGVGVGLSWLIIGGLSLWLVRDEVALLTDYFTWVGLRYAIVHNRLEAIGLSFCLGLTLAELIWFCRYLVWGLSPRQGQQLQAWLEEIRETGDRHLLFPLLRRLEKAL
ncbi:MAG: hypothetical protein AAF685_16380 [Cyanobacteria bacterium P01_C01_bin.89]